MIKSILIRLPILVSLLCSTTGILCQVYNPFPCTAPNILPRACSDDSYSITFDTDPAVTIDDWAITSADAGLNLSISSSGVLSSGNIGVGPNNYNIEITVDTNPGPGRTTEAFSFTLPVSDDSSCAVNMIPCIYQFAVILDQSGSMRANVSPTQTRWQLLNQIYTDYITTLEFVQGASATTPNRVEWSIITFGNNDASIVETDADSGSPSGLTGTPEGNTPMGGGLQRAIQDVFDDLGEPGQGKHRTVILLTDGYQNANPRVVVNDPDGDRSNGIATKSIENVGSTPGILGTGILPINLNSAPFDQIEIFTIGIGAASSSAVGAELIMLSEDDGFQGTADPVTDLSDFFDITIPAALDDFSPRIVDNRRGTSTANGALIQETFTINEGVESLTIKLVATGRKLEGTEIRLIKNGNPVDWGPAVSTGSMILYDVNFPFDHPDMASSRGEWGIEFATSQTVDYKVIAFVDEENIDYEMDFQGQGNFYAGDDLPVRLNLTFRNQPITDSVEVEATILRPGEDLGDLAARTNVDDLILREPQMLNGLAKIDQLLSDPLFVDQLTPQPRTITLNHTTDGNYEGVFTGNELSGNYRVFVNIKGQNALLGDYQGWDAKSTILDFAPADEITLNEQLITTGLKKDGTQIYQLTIRPTNRFGKLLGPGQINRIRLDFNPKEVIQTQEGTFTISPASLTQSTDNLDGTYTYEFKADKGKDFKLGVYVIDQNNAVKEAPIKDWLRKWGVSIHGGALWSLNNTMPLDSLSQGFYGELDLTYKISSKFALEAIGGYYRFDQNFDILGLTLLGKYTFPAVLGRNGNLNISAGPGIYKPSSIDATPGANVRLSGEWMIRPNLEIGAELGGFWLNDPNYQIGHLGAQLRYFFR